MTAASQSKNIFDFTVILFCRNLFEVTLDKKIIPISNSYGFISTFIIGMILYRIDTQSFWFDMNKLIC